MVLLFASGWSDSAAYLCIHLHRNIVTRTGHLCCTLKWKLIGCHINNLPVCSSMILFCTEFFFFSRSESYLTVCLVCGCTVQCLQWAKRFYESAAFRLCLLFRYSVEVCGYLDVTNEPVNDICWHWSKFICFLIKYYICMFESLILKFKDFLQLRTNWLQYVHPFKLFTGRIDWFSQWRNPVIIINVNIGGDRT